jgi:hypothetical protein
MRLHPGTYGGHVGGHSKPSISVAPNMPLSDIAIRAAKPEPKPIKLADEKGLFLLVQPSGGRLWRLKYRVTGKEKKLSLGRYPDVPLKEAREKCAESRKLIASEVDPSDKKRADRVDALLKSATTFKAVADEYITKCEREERADVTISKPRLLALPEPTLGSRPVDEVTPAEVRGTVVGGLGLGHRLAGS